MEETAPPLRAVPRKSAGTAVLLGWLMPGLGQAYVGRPGKAFFFFAVIVGTFVFGLWAAEWRAVSEERQPVWFCAQALAAGPTALAAWLTGSLEMDRAVPLLDVGLLYTSVAGLLNAVAVADAIGTVQEIADAADAAEAAEAEAEVEPPPFAVVDDGPPEVTPTDLPPPELPPDPLAEPVPSPDAAPVAQDGASPPVVESGGGTPPADGTAP